VLAESLQRAALERGLPLLESSDAREVSAHGVIATIGGREVVVGKPAFVGEHASNLVPRPGESGEAVIYAAIDGRFAGVVLLRDAVRADAADTLAALRALGVTRTLMVTGDVAATAAPIAAGLGITEVHAECLPVDKVRIIREAQPRPVVMVGDGVNDAPVLAVSDVGIAMGAKGSTAASESADVVILIDDIARVARAVAIGQRTVRIALQSIWLGIAISIALMLVAAVGLLPAIAGAALQEVVDLISIVGALRAVRAGAAPVPGLDAPVRKPDRATEPALT
jgi:P-type E1-E2 ATPase